VKARKTYITRSSIKRRKRPESKTVRIYGPPARRKFVKSLPCCTCHVEGYTEQAHVAPPNEKGTGYKADYRFIVPLCGFRLTWGGDSIGCHQLHDKYPRIFAARFPSFDPEKACAETEIAWRASQGDS
jgi:hypothetical protein